MLSHHVNILQDVFQHFCKKVFNQISVFLYQIVANKKTGGGTGGDGRGKLCDLKIFEKTGGGPGGDGTIRVIAKILQKTPVLSTIFKCLKYIKRFLSGFLRQISSFLRYLFQKSFLKWVSVSLWKVTFPIKLQW